MSNNEQEILKISRLLEPKHQDDLFTWVHLAYAAENSVKKSQDFYTMADKVSCKEHRNVPGKIIFKEE